MAAKAVEGRNVKSGSLGPAGHTEAADARERAKDFLTTAEVGRLLDATKAGQQIHATAQALCRVLYLHANEPPLVITESTSM